MFQVYDSVVDLSKVVGYCPNPNYLCYFWDKKRNPNLPKSIDLKDIYNFFGCKTLEEAADFSSVDIEVIENYKGISEMIKKVVYSFSNFSYSDVDYPAKQLIPQHLIEDLAKARLDILRQCANWVESQPWSDKAKKFFLSSIHTNVLRRLQNYNVETLEGTRIVNLVFGANFRFKSEPCGLNIFNMPVSDRLNIIPSNKDHVIYAADMRQFEFRTYLMLHPEIDVDFNEPELYKDFAKRMNLSEKDAKIGIISYLYGKKNEDVDKILNKNAILDLIEDNFFSWRGYPVVFKPSEPSYKRIHTLVQTISQYIMLEKLDKVLDLCDEKDVKFIYPFHDEVILSLNKNKLECISGKIKNILEDDVYKIREYSGKNLRDLEEINGK